HVAKGPEIRPLPRHRQSVRRSVRSDDFAAGSDELGGQEGDIADTAADVEHPHPGDDPGGAEEAARDRLAALRLPVQTLALATRKGENVRTVWPRVVPQALQLSSPSLEGRLALAFGRNSHASPTPPLFFSRRRLQDNGVGKDDRRASAGVSAFARRLSQ